ncbi:MAG: inositol monophosphatase family protein [Candidatus Hodgkinia cicadicola]
MKAREKLTFNIISSLFAATTAAALGASRWKRKTLFAPSEVEFKTLNTFGFNIETTVMEASKQLMPLSGFYGEHFGSIKPEEGCEVVWAVATSAGSAVKCLGWPTWTTSMALIQGDYLTWGAMDWPILNERLISSAGNTYFQRIPNVYNRLPPLPAAKLSVRGSVILSSLPTTLYEECALAALEAEALHVDYGFGAYAFLLLARGTIDAVIDYDISPQLLVSIIPILRGVGCVVTNWKGCETCSARRIVAARNKELASKIAATLTLFSNWRISAC